MKVITADQVGPLVPDEATLFLGGLAVTSLPEEVLQGLERHFLATGHPRSLSTWACGAVGNSGDAGMKHFAHPGMIKRVVAGHFGRTGKEMMKMVTAGGLEMAIGGGQLKIVKEGRKPKFVEQVEQITFNGRDAAERRQNVTFVTERAVFKLRPDGLELVEVAPGIDIARDVLAHMAFEPLMRDVQRMDAGIFSERWGGLAKRWTEPH
ncbi:MAG TPA: hypothetical protein VFR90_02855 [Methylibium sp.]|uniref:hypothetical protein n=1 Tax=Methylibium sp. TaxID=2067992 RepID=UPI002DB99434|nr:hypothetical protein [Methylibium sp.]HEU4458043.1 hypothetical protein [Methylibium sp.]